MSDFDTELFPALPDKRPESPDQRIAPFPAHVELGEHIVDSIHAVDVLTPRILDTAHGKQHGVAIVSVRPTTPKVSRMTLEMPEVKRAEAFTVLDAQHPTTAPIPIRFWPRFSGDHEAELSLLLRWPDDVMQQRLVTVHAHARRLDEAPANAITGPRTAGDYDDAKIPTADLSHVAEIHKTALQNVHNDAVAAAGALAGHQNNGLNAAEKAADRFAEKPPKQSTWADLAELAINIAVGSIAGAVGKLAGQKFGPKLAKFSFLKDEKQNAALTEAIVGDAAKDGLKNTVRSPLINAAVKKIDKDEPPLSTNGFVNFFAMQHEALTNLAFENARFVNRQNERLQQELITQPKHAVAAMESLAESMKAHFDVAAREQAVASGQQWTAAVAQATYGSESVQVNGEPRATTAHARRIEEGDGALMIHVDISPEGAVNAVTGASLKGIAQPIADDLWRQDLRTAPIPIIIFASSKYGAMWVTRDEVGRVRRYTPDPALEIQLHGETQRFVDLVLSKPLIDWGVKRVDTNDAKAERLPHGASEAFK